jgi:gluconolactonase
MSYGETKIFATGFEFPEGPSFDRAGNLYITDSGQKAIPRISPDGEASIFVRSEGGPNGSAFHRNGDLYVAEPGARRVVKVSPSADLQVLAEDFEGESFLAPNDITFDMKGRAYFSDPGDSDVDDPYGRVFRFDPGGEVHLVAAQMAYPNGLAVAPDGGHLIVAETFSEKLLRFSLDVDGNATDRDEFAYVGTGSEDEVGPDGMAFDEAGYLHVAIYGGGVVVVVSPGGEIVEQLPAGGMRPTNVAFGGPERRSIYITETESKTVRIVAAPRPGLRLFADSDQAG